MELQTVWYLTEYLMYKNVWENMSAVLILHKKETYSKKIYSLHILSGHTENNL